MPQERKTTSKSKKTSKTKTAPKKSFINDLSNVKKASAKKAPDLREHKAKTLIIFCCVLVVLSSALAYGYCFKEMDTVDTSLAVPPRIAFYK